MKPFYYLLGVFLVSFSSVCSAQWIQEKNYPAGPDDEAISFAIGDSVYAGAGSTGSTAFYKFDPSSNTWTQKANTLPRAAGVSFSIGLKGYAGLGQSNPTAPTFTEQQGSVTNDFWEYDPSSDTWTAKANFPGLKRDAAIAFAIGNKAYVGGGYDSSSQNIFNDFYSFDPSTNTWTPLNALPDYIAFGSTFVIGNYAYLTAYAGAQSESDSLWQYDPSSDSWNQMSDFPGAARESAVSFALDGKGYVGLGQTQYTSVFSDFYAYDPTSDHWSSVTAFPASQGRGWAVGVATPSAAFVGLGTYFSGNNLVANNDIWMFATSAAVANAPSDANLNVFPNPTAGFVSVSLPQRLPSVRIDVRNSIGAICQSTPLSSNERLDLNFLPSGIYNLEITSGDYHSSTRIVKE